MESGDETDKNPISIDEFFSKVCSTCPSNPESSSNDKKDTEKESDNENNCAVAKNITENGNRKKHRLTLRRKSNRTTKHDVNYVEEDTERETGSDNTKEISESEREDMNKKVDIKYATKNKTTKKKIGKDRKDSLIVKTLTISKRKRKSFKCTESTRDKVFNEMKDWIKHMKDEHKLEEYCCSVCGHRTKRKDKYEKHMLVHKKKKNKWKCTVCNKTFTHKCYLRRHELNHTNEKRYKCTDATCRKKVRVNSNIREISFNVWKGTKATNTNVPLADLYGHQEKIDMNMNGLFTGR